MRFLYSVVTVELHCSLDSPRPRELPRSASRIMAGLCVSICEHPLARYAKARICRLNAHISASSFVIDSPSYAWSDGARRRRVAPTFLFRMRWIPTHAQPRSCPFGRQSSFAMRTPLPTKEWEQAKRDSETKFFSLDDEECLSTPPWSAISGWVALRALSRCVAARVFQEVSEVAVFRQVCHNLPTRRQK